MSSFHQYFSNHTLLLFILISISCQIVIARDNTITKNVQKNNVIPDPSIKCDMCPCDTCPEPIPPPPPPPELPPCPPPPPPPPPCPPPPSPPPPPKEPPCSPCMEHSPPPPPPSPSMYFSPGDDLYPRDNNYYNGCVRNDVVMGVLMFVGAALLQLSIVLW